MLKSVAGIGGSVIAAVLAGVILWLLFGQGGNAPSINNINVQRDIVNNIQIVTISGQKLNTVANVKFTEGGNVFTSEILETSESQVILLTDDDVDIRNATIEFETKDGDSLPVSPQDRPEPIIVAIPAPTQAPLALAPVPEEAILTPLVTDTPPPPATPISTLIPTSEVVRIMPDGGLLNYGDIATSEISPAGNQDVFRVEGSAGDVLLIKIAFHNCKGRLSVNLRDPQNNMIPASMFREYPSCERGGGEANFVPLPSTGMYKVTVLPEGRDMMAYSISVHNMISQTVTKLDYRVKHEDTLDPPGDVDIFHIEANPGDELHVVADHPNSDTRLFVDVYDQSGQLVTSGQQVNNILSLNYMVSSSGGSNLVVRALPFITDFSKPFNEGSQVTPYSIFVERQ